MIDPEIDYRRIISGDAGALTGAADTLADVGHDLDDARGRIHDAADTDRLERPCRRRVPGPHRPARQRRQRQPHRGRPGSRSARRGGDGVRHRGAARASTTSPSGATGRATSIPVFEEILAMVVRARLVEVGTTYSQQLTAVAAVLKGDDVDLDDARRARPGRGSSRGWRRTRSGPRTAAAPSAR